MRGWTPQQIRKLRSKYALSQASFGKMLGVSNQYIHYLEKGVRTPGKPFALLLDCFEEKLKLKEKGKGKVVKKKHGKRNL